MPETYEEDAHDVMPEEFRKVIEQTFAVQSGGAVKVTPLRLDELKDYATDGQSGDLMASLLSMDSDNMECHVIMVGCDTAIRSMCQFEVTDSKDWLCELANLVCGALKSALWGDYRVDSHLGLPTIVSHGEWIDSDATWLLLGVSTGSSQLAACMQVDIAGDVMWTYQPQEDSIDDVCLF